MKRRTFLAASAAALGTTRAIGAKNSTDPQPFVPVGAGLPDLYAPCVRRSALAAGEVVVSGADRVSQYSLSVTDDVREDLIAIFDDALSQLPAHIDFGPGDLHIANQGLRVVLPRGGRGLTLSGNGTRLRLTGGTQFTNLWHCLKLSTDASGIDPASGDVLAEEDYFSDLCVSGMAFYDDDPALHADVGVEETHGINLQWIKNARITDCVVDNVGDEGIELDYCINAVVANNNLSNTTQQESSGGGAISIKAGCEGVSVLGNTIRDGGGTSTYGIAIKVINPRAVRNVTIAGNAISNMVTHGIHINVPGNGNSPGTVLVESVSITGNAINGGQNAVALSGGVSNGHRGRAVNISGNVFTGQSSGGVRINSNKYYGISVCDNYFGDVLGDGITANGNGLQFSNNEMISVRGSCIVLVSGASASINGGIYRSCGVNADALFVESTEYTDASISGINVTDCRAPTVIRDIRHIVGCMMESDANGAVLAEKMIDATYLGKGPATIINNRLADGCIEVAADDSVISGNWISHARDPGANALRITFSASNCLICGNHVAAHSSRHAIDVAGDDALVSGNHLSRSANPILVTGSGASLVANKGNEANETGSARMNPGG